MCYKRVLSVADIFPFDVFGGGAVFHHPPPHDDRRVIGERLPVAYFASTEFFELWLHQESELCGAWGGGKLAWDGVTMKGCGELLYLVVVVLTCS